MASAAPPPSRHQHAGAAGIIKAAGAGAGGAGAGGGHLKGAASKSYSVASAWERTAQLDDQQLRVIDALAAVVGQRPFPAHVSDEPAAPDAAAAAAAAAPGTSNGDSTTAAAVSSFVGSLEEAVLHNANQFHKWHSELEAACASETEEKYRQYAALLQGHLAATDGLQDQVSKTLAVFDSLQSLHGQVSSSSAAMCSSTEALLAQKATLTEFAEALRARLKFFDEYELAANQFASAAAAPDSADLGPLLTKLDECIGYVAANPQYADAVLYANKFRTLQLRALGLVRGRVQSVLRGAAQSVAAAVAEAAAGAGGTGAAGTGSSSSSRLLGGRAGSGALLGSGGSGSFGSSSVLPEGQEVSLLYVRFRAAAEPVLKGLLSEVEGKAGQPEYAQLLNDCRNVYCSIRHQVIAPQLSARLDSLAAAAAASSSSSSSAAADNSSPLPQLVRAAAEQVLRTSQLEGQLMEQLFGTAVTAPRPPSAYGVQQAQAPLSTPLAEALRPLLEPLGQLLYDLLRPRFVQLADMDTLAELIDILQHEVLRDQLARRAGPGGEALVPSLQRSMADLQERLIYRAQAFIKDSVTGFTPSPQDLAYPAKLEQATAAAAAAGSGGGAEGTAADAGEDAAAAEGEDAAAQAASAALTEQWYPPVRGTLLLLSKLYRCVDSRIFAGLAQEAVAACTLTVQAAGRLVSKASSPLDGQLFVIQHLLFLREQISHFDVDLTVTDIDLDFSHMRDHVRRIMTGQASLFTLSSSNAMVQMLGKSGPRVVSASIDSKRDLEQQLKSHCEHYIMALTKAAVEPMLGFITKVTAVRLAAGSNKELAKPLREQAFGAPAKLAELVAGVNTAMRDTVPPTVAKTRLYLPNPATRAILFRPIKSNIAEAHGQIAQLLEAEYSPEEAAQVPLLQPDKLREALDELS